MSDIFNSKLDAAQVTRMEFDDANKAMRTIGVGGSLVPDKYDHITLTYDGSGNIATVTYYSSAVQIALLTLSYDGSNRLISVVRT